MGSVPALIRKLLIANRGEIAVRIMRTARSMGIATVAVYSDADRDALHVSQADEAVRIDSYLNVPALMEAAKSTASDAVHPGYGFLAENAEFAETCRKAGLIFVGPEPATIRQMGMKDTARALAITAGVPVVPRSDPDACVFPLLIKAAAGGGGRGMRIVRSPEEMPAALESARSEAERSFGNGTLLFERYIEHARHVEVQIFGDHHGNVIHLFERDCSVQRRHQKVIEESPSTALTNETRDRLCAAAVALGKAIGYRNAGTVEFLLSPAGEFFFIEVNTRIQVEHAVTEMTTGLDLIRLQLEVAEGRPLSTRGFERRGHAIEARLYAERPADGFLPSSGRLDVWRVPDGIGGIRIDAGVREGSDIGVQYDPMLAKIIAWAQDRDSAIRRLICALRSLDAGGVETNREYLIAVLESADFREGRAHTGWALDYRYDDRHDAVKAAAVARHIANQHRARLGDIAFFRNNPAKPQSISLNIAGATFDCAIDGTAQGPAQFRIYQVGDAYYANSIAVRRVPRFPSSLAKPRHETANSPMPGVVLRILVQTGQSVTAGEPLLVLEAMKMEQTIKTTIDGNVGAILVEPGEVVAPGQMLVEIDADSGQGENPS